MDDASLSLLAGGGGGEEGGAGGVLARADSIWEQRSASVAGGCSSSLAMAEQVQAVRVPWEAKPTVVWKTLEDNLRNPL